MDELKKFEYEMIDDLALCETSLEAALIMERVCTKFGLNKLGSKYLSFIQKRSSIHHK